MWQSNGNMLKRGLSLKKPLPVIRKNPCQRYKHEYTELWNCLEPSTKVDKFEWCSTCQAVFSCAHSGRFNCKRHIKTKGHKDFDKFITNPWQNYVAILFKLVTMLKLDSNQTNAELMLCTIIAQMNPYTKDITHSYKQTIIFNKKVYDIYCRKRYPIFQDFFGEGVHSNPLAN